MMKDIKSIIIISLCLVVLFSSFLFLNVIRKMNRNQDSIAEFTKNAQIHEFFYQSTFDLNASMTGLIAPDIMYIDSKKEQVFLSNIVKEKPLLIFRFKDSNCNPCNMDLLSQIQTELSDYSSFVRMFHFVNTERELMIFKNTYNIILPLYMIPPKPFDWIIEEESVSYFFVLHSNMKISHIYKPHKDFPEQNKLYLESVIRFLE